MSDRFHICIVIPCYNEELNIPTTIASLADYIDTTISKDYQFSILLVDDGSKDNSWFAIKKLHVLYPFVHCIQLSRNVGKEIALTAGIAHIQADAYITMDADGQRPIHLIHDFLTAWRDGALVVCGKRNSMRRSLRRKTASKIFNRGMKFLTDVPFDSSLTDYMLLDHKVATHVLEYSDKNRIFRGIVLGLGFEVTEIPFDEPCRQHGNSGWGLKKLYNLAIDSVTSFSVFPLKFVGWFGLFIVFFATALLMFMTISRFFMGDPLLITNTAFFVVSNIFLSGITMVAIGVIAIYIASIHQEVRHRPLYIIKKHI